MKASQIRVLLLLGCLSNISRTRTLVELLETLLRTRGAIPYIWDLYYEPLPMPNFTYDYTHQDSGSKKVQKLMQFADEADSFVWCTPIYHNSFSGTLKNALDHLDTNYFQNKPIAFITHCHEHSSRMPDQLRIVAQGLLAMPIPTQIDTTDVDFELKDTYVLVTPRIEKLLSYIADELVEYSLFMRRYRESFF